MLSDYEELRQLYNQLQDKIKKLRDSFVDNRLNIPIYSACDYLLGNREDLIINGDNGQEIIKID